MFEVIIKLIELITAMVKVNKNKSKCLAFTSHICLRTFSSIKVILR